MKKLFLTAVLLSAFGFTSCNDDEHSSNPNGSDSAFSDNFGQQVDRDFFGRVIDLNDVPLAGVSITVGSETVQTDSNGYFLIHNAEVRERFAHIKASKPGYFDGSRSLVPTPGINRVTIKMVPDIPVATIQTGDASEVALPSGTKVTFDGAFELEDGGQYSGSVSVSMFELLPSNPSIYELMPGMLYAEGTAGGENYLKTFGMLNVELRGENGQKLQIANGHTAEISMVIDNSLIGSAPAEIPLWHFDETLGYWREDGVATKAGSRYIGEVSHFSWWNCDIGLPTTQLTVKLLDPQGNPIPSFGIAISTSNLIPVTAFSDSDGLVSGLVPANTPLLLEIIDNCGEVVVSQNIAGLTQDTSLTMTVVSNGTTLVDIVGSATACDGQPIESGYGLLTVEGEVYAFPISGSQFSYSVLQCVPQGSYTLQVFNVGDSEASPAMTLYYDGQAMDFGSLVTCTAFQAYLQGSWTLSVTNNATGVTSVFDETILLNSDNVSYRGTISGTFTPGNLAPAENTGFNFLVNGNDITVPEQNLANYWANLLWGEGTITDINNFTINHTITFAAGNRNYTGYYTRNN